MNFPINKNGNPVCPNGKEFTYLYSRPVRGNQYGRTEELYQCEDCTDCAHKEKCCKCEGNRIVRLNEELTVFHREVLSNLNSIHGALLRMNRSIQAEGVFGDESKIIFRFHSIFLSLPNPSHSAFNAKSLYCIHRQCLCQALYTKKYEWS